MIILVFFTCFIIINYTVFFMLKISRKKKVTLRVHIYHIIGTNIGVNCGSKNPRMRVVQILLLDNLCLSACGLTSIPGLPCLFYYLLRCFHLLCSGDVIAKKLPTKCNYYYHKILPQSANRIPLSRVQFLQKF